MNIGVCQRILGVPADSTPEQIRQAYQDLVRVWHPDRFQSDSRLQQIAQEHLREINEAYNQLKNYRPSTDTRSTPRPQPAPENTTRTTPPPPPNFARPSYRPRATQGKAVRAAIVAVLCALPFLAAVRVVRILRVPVLDADAISAHAFKPVILSPMRIIDPSSEVRVAADMMTEWARGDAIDLWKPLPSTLPGALKSSSWTIPEAPPQPAGGLRKKARNVQAPATISAQPLISNGTELIHVGRSSAVGDLRLVNRTNLEAIVKVVSDRTTLRAIYITPNQSAMIRHLRIGVYDLHVELGTDPDFDNLRFRKNRYTPEPLGPFEFLEITSENGIAGKHYDVALRSQ
jgi:hypothetical protein